MPIVVKGCGMDDFVVQNIARTFISLFADNQEDAVQSLIDANN
jgi:hypothetical protein